MLKFQNPTYICKSIHEVPFDDLIASGMRLVAVDVDNTLVPQKGKTLPEETRKLLKRLVKEGMIIYLASNSYRDLSDMADSFGGIVYQPSLKRGIPRKPRIGYFKLMLDYASVKPSEAVMIGDKYFFDVNPPLSIGMRTVLVNPVGKDFVGDRIFRTRFFEKFVLKRLGLKRA